MKKTFLVILLGICFLSIASSDVFADDINTLVSVSADYWMPSIDAKTKSSELGVIGTDVDLVNDLGLDDSDNIPSLKASIDFPFFPELLLSYFEIDSSATKTITKDILYKGQTYSLGDVVTSSYDITQFEALMAFSIINQEAAKFGFLIGAKYFEVETSMKSTTLSKTASVDGPVPVIGVIGAINLPAKFRLEGIARGLAIEIDNVDAKMYDIEVALNYDFNRFLRASAGYRYFLVDADDSSTQDSVDIEFAGPVLGVTASF